MSYTKQNVKHLTQVQIERLLNETHGLTATGEYCIETLKDRLNEMKQDKAMRFTAGYDLVIAKMAIEAQQSSEVDSFPPRLRSSNSKPVSCKLNLTRQKSLVKFDMVSELILEMKASRYKFAI